MIKIIVRIIVLLVFLAALLLASNKHGCIAAVYERGEYSKDKKSLLVGINFWWVLCGIVVFSGLLWIGGFFG